MIDDANLSLRIVRAMGYVTRWAERTLVKRVADPHNYGRAVDALLKGADVTGIEANPSVVNGLRDMLMELTDNELGFPRVEGKTNPHNLREVMQAFTELSVARGDSAAADRLTTLMENLLRITRTDGTWDPAEIAREKSLTGLGFSDWNDAVETPPPRSRCRMIMALTHLYRLTSDDRALELAHRFVRLARERSFTEEGSFTVHAGTHTHSITGTVHGLADYGMLVGDLDTLAHARRIFDVGLSETCSSFGWSIESIANERMPGRGEINNTGDMIQAALIFGRCGWPNYFGVAERMIRSHVLPSQWIRGQQMLTPPDAPEYAITSFPKDSDGGWGFPTPTDRHMPDPLIASASILDVTQGGIQCLWAALNNVTTADGDGVRLNLFFTSEQSAATTESSLPAAGKVRVHVPAGGRLWIRIPRWLDPRKLSVSCDAQPVNLTHLHCWSVTHSQNSGCPVVVRFPLTQQRHEEWVYRKRYRMVFAGDTLVEMEPRGTYAPMFPVLEANGDWN